MEKQVACEFENCEARVTLSRFDEAVWLPVFKATREQIGFFCPAHVAEVRAERHPKKYVLSWSGPDELIIDLTPLTPEEVAMRERSDAE